SRRHPHRCPADGAAAAAGDRHAPAAPCRRDRPRGRRRPAGRVLPPGAQRGGGPDGPARDAPRGDVAGMTASPPRAWSRLLDGAELARTVRRLAHEVRERHPGLRGVVLAAVCDGGVPLACRVRDHLSELGEPERRELPLRATYVGRNLPVAAGAWVEVVWEPASAGAWLVEPEPAALHEQGAGG